MSGGAGSIERARKRYSMHLCGVRVRFRIFENLCRKGGSHEVGISLSNYNGKWTLICKKSGVGIFGRKNRSMVVCFYCVY